MANRVLFVVFIIFIGLKLFTYYKGDGDKEVSPKEIAVFIANNPEEFVKKINKELPKRMDSIRTLISADYIHDKGGYIMYVIRLEDDWMKKYMEKLPNKGKDLNKILDFDAMMKDASMIREMMKHDARVLCERDAFKPIINSGMKTEFVFKNHTLDNIEYTVQVDKEICVNMESLSRKIMLMSLKRGYLKKLGLEMHFSGYKELEGSGYWMSGKNEYAWSAMTSAKDDVNTWVAVLYPPEKCDYALFSYLIQDIQLADKIDKRAMTLAIQVDEKDAIYSEVLAVEAYKKENMVEVMFKPSSRMLEDIRKGSVITVKVKGQIPKEIGKLGVTEYSLKGSSKAIKRAQAKCIMGSVR